MIGSIRTRRGSARKTLIHRMQLLEIVGDIDLYKLLQVVAYTQRESAFTANGMGNDKILFIRIGNALGFNFAPHD